MGERVLTGGGRTFDARRRCRQERFSGEGGLPRAGVGCWVAPLWLCSEADAAADG